MNAWQRWKAYPIQVLISLDQLANTLIPPFGALGYSDETLSARTFRAYRDGRIAGKVLMPIIDALFFWQGPNHCMNAYAKEKNRRGLPPEYR